MGYSVNLAKARRRATAREAPVREYVDGTSPDNRRAPHDSDDDLFLLGERCAEAYMQADALHYRAMVLLAEFDGRRGWEDTPFASTAEWLAWRVGIKIGPARERVRTALALRELPRTSHAMERGELSYTKVRALTRVATSANEEALLEFARAGSATNLERVVRSWKTMERRTEVEAEQVRHHTRSLSAFRDADGMVVLKGRLDPEIGSLLLRALEAASDALFEAEDRDTIEPRQRRADALGLLAERALAAGFDDQAPLSGGSAERYQVMLHVESATLSEDEEPGRSELEDGTRVSAETSRRIACDSSVVPLRHGIDGAVLDVGRRTRTISPPLRRALESRDRGCRFPGCSLRFTEAHHVKHWADGGETSLRNTVLLCRRHHRAVHEGGLTICLDTIGQVAVFTPKGNTIFDAPETSGAVPMRMSAGTGHRNHSSELDAISLNLHDRPRHRSGAGRWHRDVDVPWELEARAWEALEAGAEVEAGAEAQAGTEIGARNAEAS